MLQLLVLLVLVQLVQLQLRLHVCSRRCLTAPRLAGQRAQARPDV